MSRGRGGKIKFQALLDLEDMRKSLGTIEQVVGQTGTKLSRTGKMAKAAFGAAAAGGIAAAGVELFNHGVQLEAMERRYQTVFKGVTSELDKWIDHQNERFGVSETQLKGLAASVGDLLVPMGLNRQEAADLSVEILNVGNALGEWTGKGTAETVEIITKAMLGERDALIGLGLKLDAAEVKTRAVETAGEGLEGSALRQAEAMATLELITSQSADAMKAYGDGSNKSAKAQKSMAASLADAKDAAADLLVSLAPIIEGLARLLGRQEDPWVDLGEDLEKVTERYRELGGTAEEVRRAHDQTWYAGSIEESKEMLGALEDLVDGVEFYREQVLSLPARWITPETVEETRTVALSLRGIIAGIGDGALPKFQTAVDGIVETWRGLPDVLKENTFDVNKTIRDVLAVSAAETQFAKDMETLAEAGLKRVVAALANNPDRFAAMDAAVKLAEDIAGATRLDEAMEGTTAADQKAFLDRLDRLRQDQEILSAADAAGGEHARAYQKGWDERMGDWTPETPFTDDGLLDDIEEGLTRRQNDGGTVLQ